ncbi:MFS transporter [Paenibacillus baekrokdamisoli]|uniref:MFS transporter n=1 Tax=Paenibacillus baekrokdamisoli TaxID=1712516 RepID=A0A3G9JAR9_9BACL|nr:MFS transporter [Paenibacillus baekrokdamisoli]MBB3072082.1 PPP family 3-phenylpropionic acid transporter [Paenibacillus baekrokdamisoli]BBH20384.1 MFS transporter [Paenibacillus baekrokdamisoli]
MPVNLAYFLFFYVFIYMSNAVYGTFIPLYFQHVGFTPSQIGTLLGLGPLIAILAQPVWGTLGDRAKTKNSILLLLIAGSGVSVLLYPLSDQFLYLLAIICIFTFFQTSIFAISDAVTLEALDKRGGGNYSLIRMGGTIGFAIMSIIFGLLAQKRIDLLFGVYAIILAVCFMLVLRFPIIEGHQSKNRKIHIWVLFKNRKLMLYLAANFVLQITLGFYYAFFPLYFKELGGDSSWLGWSMLISSLSEVPFLLLSNRIFKRIKIPHILLGAGAAAALRWYLFSAIHDPLWVLPVQALHGLIFIVLSVTMATVINREVPAELKASGQTFNGLLSLGIARIIGSLVGGIASEAFGMRSVFLYNSIVALVCILVFSVIFWLQGRSSKANLNLSQ